MTNARADGQYVLVDTAYDALGNVRTVSRPHFVGATAAVTTTEHDVLGRAVSIAGADGSMIKMSYIGTTVVTTNADGM